MHRHLSACKSVFILFFILVLTASFERKLCQDSTHGKTLSNPETAVHGKYIDELYILEIKADDFKNLETDKWVFKFVHHRDKPLILHGWYANGAFGRKFKTPHNIELVATKPSDFKYSDDLLLGDVILSRKNVKKIKKLIKPGTGQVVRFTPFFNPDPHLAYKVTLIGMSDGIEKVIETFYANPSPPKGFTNSVKES